MEARDGRDRKRSRGGMEETKTGREMTKLIKMVT